MKFDFETIFDRHGKDALAVDGLGAVPNFTPAPPENNFDSIPMWVADMSFATAPAIIEALSRRIQHPLFGYFALSEKYFDAIINWQKKRNGVNDLKAENIGYENGVLGGIVSALNVLCSKGDNILVHSPTYVGFQMVLENNGYKIIHSPLIFDENKIWQMDFEDMERKIVENKIHAAIFCSPHNPCGRVWERWEIERAVNLFEKYHVYIISDEIWSDLIFGGNKHIPTQQINNYAHEFTAAFYAPTKTFNLAGLVGSYHVIYNRWLSERIEKESSLTHYNSPNVLSMHALTGGYSAEGEQWLDELNKVLEKNISYACEHIQKNYHGVKIGKPQGTYMLFADCEEFCREKNISQDELLKAGWAKGVTWHDGKLFNSPYGLRMSLAIPFSLVKEAFNRMDKYIFKISEG